MNGPNPNAKHDHVFAILRLDRAAVPDVLPDKDLITVKKVVWTQEVAEREVRRLNALNADKGCVYYWQLTRLEREPPCSEAPSAGKEEVPAQGETRHSLANKRADLGISV